MSPALVNTHISPERWQQQALKTFQAPALEPPSSGQVGLDRIPFSGNYLRLLLDALLNQMQPSLGLECIAHKDRSSGLCQLIANTFHL